ncbi:NUDIX domain-containing protein [Fulvivirga lutea]|uniref:GDP-mannose pyrophosphatase n=1 Tax=Fulvivirga lutea TaxID=2810512 RepID=A0A974WLQ2_9BACT|nr:NUDIX hydrolase [Fulvivirga lutea]QSE97713.1 NUDIX hydrolase [Fulvivirga lutea]
MKNDESPWKSLSSDIKYSNPWIEVIEHQVINPGGGKGIYGKVHFKNIAVGVIPIDEDGNTWIVGQHRFPLDEFSWEIPEGGSPLGEDLVVTAKRELKEETGLEAETYELILKMHTSNSVSDEVAFVFLAKGIRQGNSSLEESESDMQTKKLPFSSVYEMVMNGEITDSMSVAGILKANAIINQE